MTQAAQHVDVLPGHDLRADKMPGHWLLARLGKRVLRPGGLAMTRTLLADLGVGPTDDVVEFAPGLGVTACMILGRKPHAYIGVERDAAAAAWTSGRLPHLANVSVKVGQADATGLSDGCATIVIGEAMLSMHPAEHKQHIAREAYRLLRPGGQYAIHELAIVPDQAPSHVKQDIEKALSAAIHVGARPLTPHEWTQLLESVGFRVEHVRLAPMSLLRPARLIADEGLWGALRFLKNVAFDRQARRRVLTMRHTFHKHREHLSAISLIGYR